MFIIHIIVEISATAGENSTVRKHNNKFILHLVCYTIYLWPVFILAPIVLILQLSSALLLSTVLAYLNVGIHSKRRREYKRNANGMRWNWMWAFLCVCVCVECAQFSRTNKICGKGSNYIRLFAITISFVARGRVVCLPFFYGLEPKSQSNPQEWWYAS